VREREREREREERREKRIRRFPSNNQWVVRGMGGSPPDEGGSWARVWFPTFLVLACLKFLLRDKIPKKSFWGCWRAGVLFFFWVCFELTRGSRSYLQKEIVSPTSFPWSSCGHKVSELLSSTIKVPHGDCVRL
jgi:hypothetical protein